MPAIKSMQTRIKMIVGNIKFLWATNIFSEDSKNEWDPKSTIIHKRLKIPPVINNGRTVLIDKVLFFCIYDAPNAERTQRENTIKKTRRVG